MTQRRGARLTTWVDDIRSGLAVQDVFEVEPDRLPELRSGLREVAEVTRWALDSAWQLAAIEPPAGDEASLRSTAELSSIATEGDTSFARICEEIHTWVVRLLSEVDDAIARHGMVGASR